MTAASTLQMKLSQDSLFFPLPFTNATIDNVVQIQNPLPVVPSDPKSNTIAFKVLSMMQQRYSVHPSVGYIGAGDHVTIVFSFNPEQVKASKNPAERELPTEATKDAIHIDFAVVSAEAATTALAHFVPGSRESKKSREVQGDASTFWKQRGQVTENNATMRRVRLRCVFAPRNNVPESLVMRMEEEDKARKTAAEVNAAVPRTRPPATSTTDPRSTAPPEAPPHRHAETPRESSTPRNDAGHTARAAAAPATAAPSASPKPAVKFPSSSGFAEKKKDIVSAVMNFKLSYTIVAVLLVLTVLCGLLDRGNVLTWMFSR